jgi:uncharacterized protein HemX
MKIVATVQNFRLSLTASTWLWFAVLCGLFGSYAFWLSQKVAMSHNSELQYLRDENATILEQNQILEDQLQELQSSCESSQVSQGGVGTLSSSSAESQRSFVYTVKKGDTIWDIATLYNVEIKELMRWNNLGPRSQIFPGDELIIVLKK